MVVFFDSGGRDRSCQEPVGVDGEGGAAYLSVCKS